MKIDNKIEMKNSDMIFQEKQQKDLQYHLKKIINANTLQAKKYYLLIKS